MSARTISTKFDVANQQSKMDDNDHGDVDFSARYHNGVRESDKSGRFYSWLWSKNQPIPLTTIKWPAFCENSKRPPTNLANVCLTDFRKLKMIHLQPSAVTIGLVKDEFDSFSQHEKRSCYNYCINHLAQIASLRGVKFLDRHCASILKANRRCESVEFVSLYAAEVAFLLANMVCYVDKSSSDLLDSANATASRILLEWYDVYSHSRAEKYAGFQGDKDIHYESVNEYFAVLEAVHADSVLRVFPTVTRDKLIDSLRRSAMLEEVKKDLRSDVRSIMNGALIRSCPHCNLKLSRKHVKDRTCPMCHFKLPQSGRFTHYSLMTDSIIWVYLLKELGIYWNNDLNLGRLTRDFIDLARPYKSEPQIGREDFKLQLYFVAHFLLVISKFGRFRLPILSLFDEFLLILQSLPIVACCYDDAELAGEMLHVLKLFRPPLDGSDEQAQLMGRCKLLMGDVALGTVVGQIESFASSFLLSNERRGNGEWHSLYPSGRGGFYDTFHSTYCSMIGLALKRRSTHCIPGVPMKWELLDETPATTLVIPNQVVVDEYLPLSLPKASNIFPAIDSDDASPLSAPTFPSDPTINQRMSTRNTHVILLEDVMNFAKDGVWPHQGIPQVERCKTDSFTTYRYIDEKDENNSSHPLLHSHRAYVSVADLQEGLHIVDGTKFIAACVSTLGELSFGVDEGGLTIVLMSVSSLKFLALFVMKVAEDSVFDILHIKPLLVLGVMKQLNQKTTFIQEEIEHRSSFQPTSVANFSETTRIARARNPAKQQHPATWTVATIPSFDPPRSISREVSAPYYQRPASRSFSPIVSVRPHTPDDLAYARKVDQWALRRSNGI